MRHQEIVLIIFCSVGVTLIIAAKSSISVVLFMVTAFTAANYSFTGSLPTFKMIKPDCSISIDFKDFEENA